MTATRLPDDGCSATCTIEPGFTCPTPGAKCVKLEYCGDGIVQAANGEQCDDGNAIPGDGCSGVCKLEPGYACPVQGQPCTKSGCAATARSIPARRATTATRWAATDASADCTLVEPGWTCPNVGGSGGPCTKAAANTCGDGIVAGNEQCDDGNTNSDDGCSSTCTVEPGYTCPMPGKACTKIAFCGDGNVDLALGEECDDGNTTRRRLQRAVHARAELRLPDAWSALRLDRRVRRRQGHGQRACDDGNKVSGDGCSSTCSVEPGWQCPTPGAHCIAKKCGDGIMAGNEQCDDGNTDDTDDGCSATCKLEPGLRLRERAGRAPPSLGAATRPIRAATGSRRASSSATTGT